MPDDGTPVFYGRQLGYVTHYDGQLCFTDRLGESTFCNDTDLLEAEVCLKCNQPIDADGECDCA